MKELINDPRLTPTMKLLRSGPTQMFREYDPTERSFINKDNADVVLEHENREMYAQLIDDKWYWVNGCAECIGKPRDWMTYVECVKHDRCSVCETPRKEAATPHWGNKTGWICGTCKEIQKMETRAEAFAKLRPGREVDCEYTSTVICPHCGSDNGYEEMSDGEEMECHVCTGEFIITIERSITFSTEIKGKRLTE